VRALGGDVDPGDAAFADWWKKPARCRARGKIFFMFYLGVLVLLGLLILVHETGHLLAAKWMGIPVAEFAVGALLGVMVYANVHDLIRIWG